MNAQYPQYRAIFWGLDPLFNNVVWSRLGSGVSGMSCATTYQLHLADLAQLVEHLICNQRVSSSNLLIGMGLWRESASVGSCFPKYTW